MNSGRPHLRAKRVRLVLLLGVVFSGPAVFRIASAGPGTVEVSAGAIDASPKVIDKGLCHDLSDADCQAVISNSKTQFDERYRIWLDACLATHPDLRSLNRGATQSLSKAGEPDLSAAVQVAEIALVGRATDVTFKAFAGAVVSVRVETVLKGSVGEGKRFP
jgi:hypothetical protein